MADLSIDVHVAVDTDGSQWGYSFWPHGPEDARAAALDQLIKLEAELGVEGSRSPEVVAAQLTVLTATVRASSVRGLGRAMCALFGAPGKADVRRWTRDVGQALVDRFGAGLFPRCEATESFYGAEDELMRCSLRDGHWNDHWARSHNCTWPSAAGEAARKVERAAVAQLAGDLRVAEGVIQQLSVERQAMYHQIEGFRAEIAEDMARQLSEGKLGVEECLAAYYENGRLKARVRELEIDLLRLRGQVAP